MKRLVLQEEFGSLIVIYIYIQSILGTYLGYRNSSSSLVLGTHQIKVQCGKKDENHLKSKSDAGLDRGNAPRISLALHLFYSFLLLYVSEMGNDVILDPLDPFILDPESLRPLSSWTLGP